MSNVMLKDFVTLRVKYNERATNYPTHILLLSPKHTWINEVGSCFITNYSLINEDIHLFFQIQYIYNNW